MASVRDSLLGIIVVVLAGGCASLGGNPAPAAVALAEANAPIMRFTERKKEPEDTAAYQDYANYMYLYAQLSHNAYPRDSCDTPFVLPDTVRLAGSVDDSRTGFAARVYEIGARGSPLKLAVAFRGTEGPFLVGLDWRTGNWGSRQQRQALAFFDSVRTAYTDRLSGQPVSMVATGHSLGGALAIQVSVLHPNVLTYVFNTSYRKLLFYPGDTIANSRVSVSETFEVAKFVRWILPNPTILHLPDYDCTKGHPISNHGIEKLARCLTRIAAAELPAARESLARNPIVPSGSPACAARAASAGGMARPRTSPRPVVPASS